MEDLRQYIQQLREDFMHGELDETHVDSDPGRQFQLWLKQAVEARIPEVQAMSLSSVSGEGRPSCRIVYLREFEAHNYCFYTNYNSRKSSELHKNPYAAATFFWPELERQVRMEGKVIQAPAEQSDAYFNARPYESKLGAWASNQSSELASRQALEERMAELQREYSPETITRPPHWGGLILQAEYYEFWQGRKSRLHDRIAYRLENEQWQIARLAP